VDGVAPIAAVAINGVGRVTPRGADNDFAIRCFRKDDPLVAGRRLDWTDNLCPANDGFGYDGNNRGKTIGRDANDAR